MRKYEGEQDVDWPAVSYAPLPGLPCTVDVPAMRCPLGLEADPYHYVGHLVLVMREMHRVLRGDGVLWLNLGDSFAGSWGNYGARNGKQRSRSADRYDRKAYEDDQDGWAGLPPTANVPGLKPKDMIQIPELVSLALKADGWWVRSRLPWIKRNGMPGSQTDRPTTSHESIFVLAKSARYFWDQVAISKPHKAESLARVERTHHTPGHKWENGPGTHRISNDLSQALAPDGRYRRTTDWWFESLDEQIAHLTDLRENGGPMLDEDGMVIALQVNTKGYSKAHFATWPPELVRPMIRAGTSARGVCPACGAPWARVVEKIGKSLPVEERYGRTGHNGQPPQISGNYWTGPTTQATGDWAATCTHADLPPIPATVLDPFSGSGTTGMVAIEEGREYIGVDISQAYLEDLAPERLTAQIGLGL